MGTHCQCTLLMCRWGTVLAIIKKLLNIQHILAGTFSAERFTVGDRAAGAHDGIADAVAGGRQGADCFHFTQAQIQIRSDLTPHLPHRTPE